MLLLTAFPRLLVQGAECYLQTRAVPTTFRCPAHECVLCLWTEKCATWRLDGDFCILSLGAVVDGLADGMTGLMWGYQNSCLKEQKGGRGRVRGSSEFRSFALPFLVLSLRMVLN